MPTLLSFFTCGGDQVDGGGDLQLSSSVWLQRGGGEEVLGESGEVFSLHVEGTDLAVVLGWIQKIVLLSDFEGPVGVEKNLLGLLAAFLGPEGWSLCSKAMNDVTCISPLPHQPFLPVFIICSFFFCSHSKVLHH